MHPNSTAPSRGLQADPPSPSEPALKLHAPTEPALGEFITQRELYGRLKISKATFSRMKASGKIGPVAVRVNGSLRYDLDEVRAWFTERRHDASLHDARTWAPLWPTLKRKGGRA